ncbi:hypothetical protein DEU56DRAFT_925369 [Suillus clintonianus]|uniref:uncharacterized protein n=1 Tax=Suillus clintonianus TaxID=1904413 RepID=UPI001B86BC3E|nr:uncharacterized protein DEU56DRAFT_925369 [Suillus clintonianus]KAG2122928.1 hypothetical protein DEU56DRAFT_925369 [Suillus clintonianus]
MSESESSIVMSVLQGPLCGTLATMLLYGVVCMQTFHYWQAYEHDGKILKSVVAFIWILETAHTALSIHFVEYYLIIHFGELLQLLFAVWSMGATYFVGFIIGYAVNLCFIWRILLLSQKRWIAVLFVIVATVRCGFGLANCVLSWTYPLWTEFRIRVFSTMVVGQVLSAVVDGAIALTLCLYIRKLHLVALRTDSVLNRLLLYSINTGAATSLFAILAVIVFLVLPTNPAFIAFVQVQSKLYAISLLASLNTRKSTFEMTKQSVPAADGVALSLFKTTPQHPSYMHPIKVQKSAVMDIYGDDVDTYTGNNSTTQESEC